jgi:hypothetical protein
LKAAAIAAAFIYEVYACLVFTSRINLRSRTAMRFYLPVAAQPLLKIPYQANGIKEPRQYIEHNGIKYIVGDGGLECCAGIKNWLGERVEWK